MADPTLTTTPSEEWRPVVGYEGIYEVSSLGRVRRSGRGTRTHVGRLLSPMLREKYYRVSLFRRVAPVRKVWTVHRLVCIAFHGAPPSPKHHARHLNGNSLDNRVENLAWGTGHENALEAVEHGALPSGSRCGQAKLTPEQVVELCIAYRDALGPNGRLPRGALIALQERFGLCGSGIGRIVQGLSYKKEVPFIHKGRLAPKKPRYVIAALKKERAANG